MFDNSTFVFARKEDERIELNREVEGPLFQPPNFVLCRIGAAGEWSPRACSRTDPSFPAGTGCQPAAMCQDVLYDRGGELSWNADSQA